MCIFAKFCKHCRSKKDEGLRYLENGFARIHTEADILEKKIDGMTGILLKRHRYSADELMNSGHFEHIESIAGKIKSDIDNWQRMGKLSTKVKEAYNNSVDEVQNRIGHIIQRIEQRKPTAWETLKGFFSRLFKAIAKILPKFVVRFFQPQKENQRLAA